MMTPATKEKVTSVASRGWDAIKGLSTLGTAVGVLVLIYQVGSARGIEQETINSNSTLAESNRKLIIALDDAVDGRIRGVQDTIDRRIEKLADITTDLLQAVSAAANERENVRAQLAEIRQQLRELSRPKE